MKKILLAVAGILLLTGCRSFDWEGLGQEINRVNRAYYQGLQQSQQQQPVIIYNEQPRYVPQPEETYRIKPTFPTLQPGQDWTIEGSSGDRYRITPTFPTLTPGQDWTITPLP